MNGFTLRAMLILKSCPTGKNISLPVAISLPGLKNSNTVRDKNSHIFKHLSQFPSCKGMYTPSCFRILDSANSSIDLKLKEAFYISIRINLTLTNNYTISTLF